MYAKTSLTAHKINTQNAKFTKKLLVCRSIKITPTVRYWHSFYPLGVSFFFSSLTFSKGSNLCWNAMLKKTFASKILMLSHTFFWESTLESWPMIRNAPMEMKSKHHRWKIFRNVYLAFMALDKCTRKKKKTSIHGSSCWPVPRIGIGVLFYVDSFCGGNFTPNLRLLVGEVNKETLGCLI